jgi:hypothetical protein
MAPVGAQESGDWQLVLLKPPDCGLCSYSEEVLKRRGFVQRAELTASGGRSITARVVRRVSADLTPQETTEVAALPYIDMALWKFRAQQKVGQVLLERDGHVVAAGSLTETADLRRATLPEKVLAPPPAADLLELRGELDKATVDSYLRSWNFDYFYELALDPRRDDPRSMANYVKTRPVPGGAPPPPRNLVLVSTATWPGNNEIFNATRVTEVRDIAQRDLGVAPQSVSILYGGGNPTVPNAVEIRAGQFALTHYPIENSRPATMANVADLFLSLSRMPATRNLFVFVGHGGPEGAGLWGQVSSLSPEDLSTLHKQGKGDDVIVSGNCFGGVMARAMSCGFFAARPDIVATGCQADAVQVAQSRDYLKMFFAAVTPEERARADTDHDGVVSFEEAHWFASVQGDNRNVTYTTVDSLADDWFARHPEDLPRNLTVRDLLQLAAQAPPAKQQAIRRMTDGLTPQVEFSLLILATQANEWTRTQSGVRPMIAQVARRLLFVQRHGAGNDELTAARACEARPIAKFLAP